MWFSVSIFYRGKHLVRGPDFDIWEESFILVEAIDEAQAESRASEVAEESITYKTVDGDEICWSFDSIDRVHAIDSEVLKDGVELFSRFLRPKEVVSLKAPFDG